MEEVTKPDESDVQTFLNPIYTFNNLDPLDYYKYLKVIATKLYHKEYHQLFKDATKDILEYLTKCLEFDKHTLTALSNVMNNNIDEKTLKNALEVNQPEALLSVDKARIEKHIEMLEFLINKHKENPELVQYKD